MMTMEMIMTMMTIMVVILKQILRWNMYNFTNSLQKKSTHVVTQSGGDKVHGLYVLELYKAKPPICTMAGE